MNLINDPNYRNTTLAAQAERLAEERPSDWATAFDSGVSITFAEAWHQAKQLAGALQRAGLNPGDTLTFQLPNTPEAVIVAIASSICGLIINPVVPIYRGKELGFILNDAETRILFIPGVFRNFDFPAMIANLRGGLPKLEHVICVTPNSALPEGFQSYTDFFASGSDQPVEHISIDPDTTKILLYTSGTTGNPKAVRHSHNTLAAALDNGAQGWQLNADDIMLMPSPVTHITGYVNGIELPFYTDTRSILMESWDVHRAIEIIDKQGATTCVSATPFLQELVHTCREQNKTLPGFRLFACGGASVPPALIYDAMTTLQDCRAVRVYGSTEVPLVTVGFCGADEEKLAAETDGHIHNYDVIVVDDDGKDVGTGVEGEILVKGPAMMLGYASASQNSAAFTADGYFKTGDIGKLLPTQAVVITDRKKDIIIRGGENISAREVEEAILQHPSVREAAVVAAPHQRLGEGIAAFVILHEGATLSLDQLTASLDRIGLAKQKWPQHLEPVGQLPKTASGKVQKEILRRQLKDRGILL